MLSERRILCLKSDIRLEWRGQDGRDETEQGTHYPLTLGDSLSRSIRMRLAYPVCCQSCYRVSPLAAVECLVGRCRGMCRNSQDRVECRHWIETPVEAKHKFVEVSL